MNVLKRLFSYQVWRLLHSQIPLRHPYTRLLQQEYIAVPRPRQWLDWAWIFIIGMAGAWFITSDSVGGQLGSTLGILALMISVGNLGGVWIGIHTITLIHAERRKRRDELITLTGLGYIGMVYSILYIAFKRPRWLHGLISIVMASVTYGVIVVSLFLIYRPLENIPMFILLGLIAFMIYYDTLQSIVLGGIFSASIGSRPAQDRLSAQVTAISLFILLQLALYTLSSMIVYLLRQSMPDDEYIHLLIYSAGLFILFSSREGIIYLLIAQVKRTYGESQFLLGQVYPNL